MIKKLGFLVQIIRRPAVGLLIIGMVLMASSVTAAPPCDAPLNADAVLCLESDQDITSFNGTVTAWSDQSGSGNDLIASGTPTIGDATTPTGEPAISFKGGGAVASGGIDYSWITAPTSDVTATLSDTFANVDEWPFSQVDNQSINLISGTPGTHVWGFPDMSSGPGENKGWRVLAMMRTSSSTSAVNVDVVLKNNGAVVSTHPTVQITSTSDIIYSFFFPDIDTNGTTFNAPEVELTYARQGGNTAFRVSGLLLSRSPIKAANEAIGYGALAGTEVQAFRSSDLVRLGGNSAEAIVHWPDATGRGQHVGIAGPGTNATLQINGTDSWINFETVRLAGVVNNPVTGDIVRMIRYRAEADTSDRPLVSTANEYAGRWDTSTPLLAQTPGITDKFLSAISAGGGGGFEDMIMAGDGSGPAHVYSGVVVAANTWYNRTDLVQEAGNEKVWRNDEPTPIIDAAGVAGTNDLMRISIGNRESDNRPYDGDISEIWHYDMAADGGRVEADIDNARNTWMVSSDSPGDKLERTAALSGLPTGNADRTMFVVGRYDSAGVGGYAYGNTVDNEAFGLGVDGSGDLMLYGRGATNNFSSAMAGNGAGWKIQSVIKSGNALSHYVDGSLVDSQSHTHNTVADRIVLGADIDSGLFVDSDIAAVLVYDRALSGAEHTQVENYLQTKYISTSTVPGAPQNLAATPGDQQVALAWDAPASDGGSAITGYLVEYKENSSGIWTDAGHSSTATNATIGSLTNGTLYDFRVSATNANGTGSATMIDSIIPTSTASAPQNISAAPGDRQVALDWQTSASDGGSAITEYLVEYKLSSAGAWTDANHNSLNTDIVITGLVNGSAYDFRVAAVTDSTGSFATIVNITPFTDVPNLGDANNDGTHDVDQQHVDGLFSSITGDYVVLEVDAVCEITVLSLGTESINAAADSGFDYPVGLMSFTTDCGTPGYTTTVTQYYYGVSKEDLILRKYNPSTNAYFTVTDATLEQVTIGGHTATRVTYQVTDGGDLDIDRTANGVIVDPVGLAQSVVGAPNTGLGGRR